MAKKDVNENKNKKSFFKDFKAELKRVSWPTPKQLLNNTVAVITIVLITAVIVFVLDFVFEAINSKGVEKVKELIGNETTVENTTTDENATSEENASTDENATSDENASTDENTTSEEATNETENQNETQDTETSEQTENTSNE